MFKRVFQLVAALGTFSLLLAGCGSNTGEVQASLGQEFTLSINQTATISGQNLSIKFIDVTEDSRCPTGAT